MTLPKFVYTWIGKFIGSKINLKEDKDMGDTKKWWLSKGVWVAVVTGIMGIYTTLQPTVGLPVIPEWIFAILGGLGLYSRVTATKTIG
jgi:hypothetical protein